MIGPVGLARTAHARLVLVTVAGALAVLDLVVKLAADHSLAAGRVVDLGVLQL